MVVLLAFCLILSAHASLKFSGTTNAGHVNVGSGMSYIGTSYTISFWMRAAVAGQFSTTHEQVFVARDNNSGSQTQIWIESSSASPFGRIQANCGGAQPIKSITTITNANWHHIALTQSAANSWAIYIDGSLDNTSTTSCTPNSTANNMRFAQHLSSNFPFAGDMAEVAIWSTPLSASEIKALSLGVTPNYLRMSNLLLYLPFYRTSGNGDTVADLSGHQLSGTVVTGLGNVQTDDHCPCSLPAPETH